MEPTIKEIAKFWTKVSKLGKNDCWNWLGCLTHGYGVFCIGRKGKVASRVSYIINKGEIPSGLCVLHKCDNPKCVNPSHLFLGTKGDNNKDKVSKNRQARGASNKASKLDEVKVSRIRREYERFGAMDMVQLGLKYRITPEAIWKIIHRITWKHV